MEQLYNISLSESQLSFVKEATFSANESLQRDLDVANQRVIEIKRKIEDNQKFLSQISGINPLLNGNYNNGNTFIHRQSKSVNDEPNQSWWQRVAGILESEGRRLTSSKILEILFEREPLLKETRQIAEKTKANVFAITSTKATKGKLIREKVGKEYMYSLPLWNTPSSENTEPPENSDGSNDLQNTDNNSGLEFLSGVSLLSEATGK